MELVTGGPFKSFPRSQVTRANNLEQSSVVLIKRRDLSCKNSFAESFTSQHTEQRNAAMGLFGCNAVILADPYSWGTANAYKHFLCRSICSEHFQFNQSSARPCVNIRNAETSQYRHNTDLSLWRYLASRCFCSPHESIVTVFPCSLLHLLWSELLPKPPAFEFLRRWRYKC